jgi:hypothetical protein
MFTTSRSGWMFVLAVAGVTAGACGGRATGSGEETPIPSGGAADGGSSAAPFGNGGTAGAAGAPSVACNTPVACGGDVVGDWDVADSCLDVTGDADVGTLLGVGCATAPMRGVLEVSGGFVVGADGSVRDETTTTGEIDVTLSRECLAISGTLLPCADVSRAFGAVQGRGTTCTATASGCSCRLEMEQRGSMGQISFAPTSVGVARADGTLLHVEGDIVAEYDYCSTAEHLTVTPRGGGLALKTAGSIELDRQRGAK